MILLIPAVSFHTFTVSPVVLMEVFTPALFTPIPQTSFGAGLFVKLILVLPLLAATAQLLFDTSNYPVALLVSQKVFRRLPVLPVPLSVICSNAAFAPNPQSVLAGTVFAKLTFFFPLLTLGTAFLLNAIHRAMAFLITVVTSCHCLLVPLSHLPLLTSLVGSLI